MSSRWYRNKVNFCTRKTLLWTTTAPPSNKALQTWVTIFRKSRLSTIIAAKMSSKVSTKKISNRWKMIPKRAKRKTWWSLNLHPWSFIRNSIILVSCRLKFWFSLRSVRRPLSPSRIASSQNKETYSKWNCRQRLKTRGISMPWTSSSSNWC